MEKLIKKLAKTPKKPGIYFLKNKKGEVIYVGKAKNLKNRLKNHYQLKKTGFLDIKAPWTQNLYEELFDFKFKTLNSEIEALVEESKFIKKLRPKYNILARDDKKYFYVAFTKDSLPRLFLTHQPKIKTNIDYLGPFTSGTSLKYTLKLLRRIYPFKTCTNKIQKPCFYFYLGLCPAHINNNTNDIKQVKALTKYNLNKVKQVLQGKAKSIIIRLKRKMKKASDNLLYEKANEILKEIKALENIMQHKNILKEQDFDERFYKELRMLQQLLKLKTPPKRIEIFDISNLGRDYIVGAMTVFKDANIAPQDFRLFKIKLSSSTADPQRIYEIINRRLAHSLKTSKQYWPKPDIILIDGGKAQLSYAVKALKNSKIKNKNKIKLISLAKPNHILYIYNYLSENYHSIDLNQKSNLYLKIFILSLINTAHKFAKKYLHKVLLKNLVKR